MTPHEKAKKLVDKFMHPIDELNKYPMCFDTAKQCALIAVDEIINVTVGLKGWIDGFQYWEEVKQEIEKL